MTQMVRTVRDSNRILSARRHSNLRIARRRSGVRSQGRFEAGNASEGVGILTHAGGGESPASDLGIFEHVDLLLELPESGQVHFLYFY